MMVDGLARAFNEVFSLWAKAINERGGLDPLVLELSTAATALRNARDLAAYPDTKIMDTVTVEGVVHALRPGNILTSKLYCGAVLSLENSQLSARRVPSCPACIEAIRKESAP